MTDNTNRAGLLAHHTEPERRRQRRLRAIDLGAFSGLMVTVAILAYLAFVVGLNPLITFVAAIVISWVLSEAGIAIALWIADRSSR